MCIRDRHNTWREDFTLEDFLALFPVDEPQYGIWMYEQCDEYYPLFFFWCPTSTRIRLKMTFSLFKKYVKKSLCTERNWEHQACDRDDLNEAAVHDTVGRFGGFGSSYTVTGLPRNDRDN
eukprot:TRINITY_DN6726_c0_g1_i1.p1 TRINITY_DN6726_c0_g1~~TRINITY_DN6726_c0_g1_i1.p1  ORF type:complete len:120 (+),score=13.00 TRINITY_DN6726_c0_g1_i1:26-385(+)